MPFKTFYLWFNWLTHRRRVAFVVLMTLTSASAALLGAAIFHSSLAAVERGKAFRALVSLERLMSTLRDAETGQRGYLLAEKAEYLEPYAAALHQIRDRVATVRRYRSFPPETIDRLESETYAKVAELEETVRMAVEGRRDEAIGVVRTDRGKAIMDNVRHTIDVLQADEESRVLKAENALLLSSRMEIAGFVIGTSCTIVLVVALITAYGREERARVEAEVRRFQAAERYRAITEAAPGAIVGVDHQLTIDQWNRMASGTFGWNWDEITGRPATILVAERNRDDYLRVLVASRGPVARQAPVELFGLHKNGTEFPAELYVDFFVIDGKRHAILIWRDITPRRHMEAQREGLRAELQRSNAELQKFAYVASHDLQEPLRMISKFAGLLGERYEQVVDEQGRRYIVLIRDAVQRMQALISDLLTYSRITSKSRPFAPVELNVLVHEVITDLQDLIAREGGTVRIAGRLPSVSGKSFQLRQLFQNLISNGLKFHRPGVPPEVVVTVGDDDGDGDGLWHFAVSDNGIGIDPGQRAKLFQLFTRLHAREDFEGTGIGLAVCQKIVEHHGGEIWIEGAPGVGSTFRFTLAKDHQNAG